MIDDEDVEEFLEHFGVKGMRWGHRKGPQDVSRRTDREAAKDAKEFARAKQFFGEGAGNRRKLIKSTVEAKSKRDSSYAKAFERHLSDQESIKDVHAEKARGERKSIDRKARNKQRRGALARGITGQQGTQAAFVALALTGAAFMGTPKGQQMMRQGMSKVNDVRNEVKRRNGARHISRMFNL